MLLKVPDSLVHLSQINSHNFSRVIFFRSSLTEK